MRFIDRYIGKLIIFLLIPVMWVLDHIRKEQPPRDEVQVLLFQKLLGMGSIINSIPAIEEAKKQFPNARIVFLTFTQQKEICEIIDDIDEVITVDPSSLTRFVASCVKAIYRFWKLRIDICLDFEFFSNFSMIISCLSGATTRVGFFSFFSTRSQLLTHPAAFNHYRHISHNFVAMVEIVGENVSSNVEFIELPSFKNEYINQISLLTGANDETPLVIVNPNTSNLCRYRSWPSSKYAELLARLVTDSPGCTYVLIGGASEHQYVQEIIDLVGSVEGQIINLAGKTNLRCLMALIEYSHLLISNDSGPAHIAAGYGVNEIVLFGPETPVLYKPLNKACTVYYHPPFCSPCLNVLDNKKFGYCEDVICMENIDVNEVYSTAMDVINNLATDPSTVTRLDRVETN